MPLLDLRIFHHLFFKLIYTKNLVEIYTKKLKNDTNNCINYQILTILHHHNDTVMMGDSDLGGANNAWKTPLYRPSSSEESAGTIPTSDNGGKVTEDTTLECILRFVFNSAKAANLAGGKSIFNVLSTWSTSMLNDIELIAPHITEYNVWIVKFKTKEPVKLYANRTIKFAKDECKTEDASCNHQNNPARNTRNPGNAYKGETRTRVTFRLSGLPHDVDGLTLIKELNNAGFNLNNVSDLSHVLWSEENFKKFRIKNGIIEVRQYCSKEDQVKYQKLAWGRKKLTFGGKAYGVNFTRPGICFKCNTYVVIKVTSWRPLG